MDFIKNIYLGGLDLAGDAPSWKRDWRWVTLYCAVVYALVLAVRLSMASRWDAPELWVAGERIMATHDAYYWLAKAKGVGVLAGYPLAQIAAWLHGVFGIGLGTLGFWMPAFMGSLVAVVCYLWGWLLGGRNSGIFAGLAGALTPGFFFRSRLGYFDTDMFTLLVPLAVAWMLAYWASHHLRRGWFAADGSDSPALAGNPLWLALAFGLVTHFAGLPHQDIVHFNVLITLFAAVVVMVGARPGQRPKALYGLTVFSLAAFPGTSFGLLTLWPVTFLKYAGMNLPVPAIEFVFGVVLAVGLILLYGKNEKKDSNFLDNLYVSIAIFVACLLATEMLVIPLEGSLHKVLAYFGRTASGAGGSEPMGPIYPSVMQSIIEAKFVPVSVLLTRGAFAAWIGGIALAVAAFVAFLRPAAVFLLPLVALHFASLKLGVRFTMFGGAPLMILLGVSLFWLGKLVFKGTSRKEIFSGGIQAVLGIVCLVYCYTNYGKLPLTPVVPRGHAEALIELGKTAPKDAMIWTWWDWGYASQYYAGLETVADGGKHSGRDVYPVGFVMSTALPEKANRMVAFSAQYSSTNPFQIGLNPAQVWDAIPRKDISETLERQLSRTDYPTTPPQYLVVSWRDMSIVKWITYFGNWNLQTGVTHQASSGSYTPGQLAINAQRGAIMNRRGGGGLVKDITVLDWDNVQFHSYFMNAMSPQLLPKRQHLIVNKVTGKTVLMDRIAYTSLMRRLLMDDPQNPEIAKYFKLVVDKLPFARIYEVIQ